jgi:hypothetical protein
MTEPQAWPTYSIGPKDSIFALGVVSVNYARFEHAIHAMFAVILGIDSVVSHHLMFKIGPELRDKLMREMLPTWPWPQNVMNLAEHFITAQKTCYDNRNLLMHSNLITGSEKAAVLYKHQRDGKLSLARPSIKELRQVADDMQKYYNYGMHLSSMIRFEILKHQPMPGEFAFSTWPEKPALPKLLDYTSGLYPNTAQSKHQRACQDKPLQP